jgi:hypothetical protein
LHHLQGPLRASHRRRSHLQDFIDQCDKHDYRYYIRILPDGPFEQVIDSNDKTSEEEGQPTPEDSP